MKTNRINSFVNNLLLLISFLFLSVLGSCKDKCETESCGGGRYVINGNCECPPGSYWYDGRCVEKNPGYFRVDSTTCDCINTPTKLNIIYRPADIEDPNNFDPRFNRYSFYLSTNYPIKGASDNTFYYDKKFNTIYTSVFYEAFFGKQCNENSFAFGQFYNVGGHVRNKLKLRVYSYSVPEHEIRVAYPDKESYSKATDSCTIWMSNGL
jgi:hypothetical protein